MGYSRSRIVDADNPSALVLTAARAWRSAHRRRVCRRCRSSGSTWSILRHAAAAPGIRLCQKDRRKLVLPELSDEVASPDAALHIGPQFVAPVTAALDAAAETAGTGLLAGRRRT